ANERPLIDRKKIEEIRIIAQLFVENLHRIRRAIERIAGFDELLGDVNIFSGIHVIERIDLETDLDRQMVAAFEGDRAGSAIIIIERKAAGMIAAGGNMRGSSELNANAIQRSSVIS